MKSSILTFGILIMILTASFIMAEKALNNQNGTNVIQVIWEEGITIEIDE